MAEIIELSATETNINVPWGVDVVLEATISEDGSARNITTDTVKLTVRRDRAADSEQLFAITNGPADHETPASGVTRFAVTAAQLSTNLPRGRSSVLAYAIRSLGGDAKQRAHIRGEITVTPDAGELVTA